MLHCSILYEIPRVDSSLPLICSHAIISFPIPYGIQSGKVKNHNDNKEPEETHQETRIQQLYKDKQIGSDNQ